MRWPWRRRRKPVHLPTHRLATWAEAAMPPPEDDPDAPVVRLGFADGTIVQLDPSSPGAVALREVAVVLHQGHGNGRR